MKAVPKRAYTPDFRDAARQVLEGGRSIAAVARSLEMSSKSLANWVYRARKGQDVVKRSPAQPVSEMEVELEHPFEQPRPAQAHRPTMCTVQLSHVAGCCVGGLVRFFATAADVLGDANPSLAEKLRRATPHWMRHTHATHALQRGAELTTVRDNLRHASLSTTSMYLHSDDLRRAKQIGGAFDSPAA